MADKNLARTSLTTLEIRTDLVRTETLNGKQMLVAPVVPIVEGVHNGEFVSYEELSVFPDSWDGIPLPIDHPQDAEGEPVTANSPAVMESSVIGMLFNVVAREDIRGISGELWIDIEKAGTVPGGVEVLRKLQAGEKLEVSTAYNTFVKKDPGEFRNLVTGETERYTFTQVGLRPDHLAMLPYDLGACSWKDGCGAPRLNGQHLCEQHNKAGVATVESKVMATETKTTPEIKPAENAQAMKVNGKQLSTVLNSAIAAHAGIDGNSTDIVARMAAAANIPVEKVQEILAGTLDFIPRAWLTIFSAVLDIDPWDMMMACSNDNSDARYSTYQEDAKTAANESQEKKSAKTEIPVTQVDNSVMPIDDKGTKKEHATNETKPCGACEKSFSEKVSEVVNSTLIALGVRTVNQETQNQMDKKAKVEALIASGKTQFAENNREWLMGLDDATLALLEPKADEKPVVNTQAATAQVVAATSTTEVKPEVKAEPVKQVINRDEVLAALGISAEDIAALKGNSEKKKADRAARINQIAAIAGCPYSKEDLEAMTDSSLEKTINLLQPEGFRVVGSSRSNADADQYTAPPSILFATVTKEAK